MLAIHTINLQIFFPGPCCQISIKIYATERYFCFQTLYSGIHTLILNIMQIILVFLLKSGKLFTLHNFILSFLISPFSPEKRRKSFSTREWDQVPWKRYFMEKALLSTLNPALRKSYNPAHSNHLENKKIAEQACSAQPSHRAPFQVKTGLVLETSEEM